MPDEPKKKPKRRSVGASKSRGWSAVVGDQQDRKRLIERTLIAMNKQRKRIRTDQTKRK